MQVRQRHSTDTHRHGAPRRRPTSRRDGATAPSPAAVDQLADEHRLRDSGGPDDSALYRCGCGTAFRADVSASVSCPRCGGDQAW
jgi:hypothetical protein